MSTGLSDRIPGFSEFPFGIRKRAFRNSPPEKLNIDNTVPETSVDLLVSAASAGAFYAALDRGNIETVFFAENSFGILSSAKAAA